MKRPNILLIQTDQLSAESLGLYGNAVVRTPGLERLADEGVRFDNCYCNYPACVPSRASMLTGRYATTLRSHANFVHLDPREVTLVHALNGAGYQTALVGKNHAFTDGSEPGTGGGNCFPDYPPEDSEIRRTDELHRLFDYVREGGHNGLVEGYEDDPEVRASSQWAIDHCWRSPVPYGKNPYDYRKGGSYLLGSAVIEYLQDARDPSKPFFLWLSFPDPHTPYQVQEPYASLYDPADVPLPPTDSLEGKPERQRVAHLMDAMDRVSEDHLRRVRAIHYGMINFVDDNIQRVLDTLDELDLREDTLILFTADHGDSMGAHGLIQKHNCFYDSITRVPLIVTWPGTIAARRNSEAPVSLVDLMPTILDMAGVDVPYGVQGQSLSRCLLDGEPPPVDFAVMESGEAGEPPRVADIKKRPAGPWDESCFVWCAYREAWLGRGKSIRTADWKLNVYTSGEGELYDMRSDPDELVNLYDDPAYGDVIAHLKSKLLDWSIKMDDRKPRNTTVRLTVDKLWAET
jgi:arylsulfatase A-like enzyme